MIFNVQSFMYDCDLCLLIKMSHAHNAIIFKLKCKQKKITFKFREIQSSLKEILLNYT